MEAEQNTQSDEKVSSNNLLIYQARKADPSSIWILFLFIGWSYGSLGSMWKQILYYLTFYGFGLWFIYRLLTLNRAIRKYNKKIAKEIGINNQDLIKLGF